MKMGVKEKNLLLGFLGVLLVIVTYFFVLKKFEEMTDKIVAENGNLQTAITKLEGHQKNLEVYEEDTVRLAKETKELKETYPSAIMNEDKILYVKSLEDLCDINVSYIGLDDVTASEVEYPKEEKISVDSLLMGQTEPLVTENPNGVYMMDHGLALNYEGGYESIKQLLGAIVEDAQQKSVHSISLSYNDATGELTGTMDTSMYSMTGNGVAYTAPDLSGVEVGMDDIFKTFERQSITTEE